jgi:hypothetical protein
MQIKSNMELQQTTNSVMANLCFDKNPVSCKHLYIDMVDDIDISSQQTNEIKYLFIIYNA